MPALPAVLLLLAPVLVHFSLCACSCGYGYGDCCRCPGCCGCCCGCYYCCGVVVVMIVVLVVVLELLFPGALPLASAGVGGYDSIIDIHSKYN